MSCRWQCMCCSYLVIIGVKINIRAYRPLHYCPQVPRWGYPVWPIDVASHRRSMNHVPMSRREWIAICFTAGLSQKPSTCKFSSFFQKIWASQNRITTLKAVNPCILPFQAWPLLVGDAPCFKNPISSPHQVQSCGWEDVSVPWCGCETLLLGVLCTWFNYVCTITWILN